MPQLNKISDVYVPMFDAVQNNFNKADVMTHLIKLTNASYQNTIEKADQAQVKAETATVSSEQGAGVINDRKKAMQARLKAAIGNSRL